MKRFSEKPKEEKRPLEMKDIQKVSLGILKFVTGICERNGFRYSLMYGTLIGAIRHKGYIPWDDDVDIMMPRPDYEKFLEYVRNHKEDMGVYEVFNESTHKDYLYTITRVSDSRYEIFKDDEKNCGMGIFIDVYPYDGLGDDYDKALDMLRRTRRLCDIIVDITRTRHNPSSMNWRGQAVMKLKRMVNSCLGLNYFRKKLTLASRIYDYDKSEFVGPAVWYFTNPKKVLFRRSMFDDLVKVPFEDGEFYVPADYDSLLTQEYGNYMQLPPPEKRIYQHQYKAYRK